MRISLDDGFVGQGRDAAKQAIAEKPELAAKLTAAIKEKITVTGGAVVTGGGEAE